MPKVLMLLILIAATACDSPGDGAASGPASSAEEAKAKAAAKVTKSDPHKPEPITKEDLEQLHPWRNVSDARLTAEVDAARAVAKKEGKHVLLDFVASWCHDCVEVVKVAKQKPASDVIDQKYVYVPINVGKWDRAESFRELFEIKKIATLVVLDADGRRIAQSTLEPISSKKALTPEALAKWLEAPSDDRSALDGAPNVKSAKEG